MPRPGPRPYECVKRSWHSDRHQPIRGSIIQQIFRVAHESHCSSTKSKREWQEKLPLVVLKSEEIMYSKANSEAEYLDPETLWDRINDAINTIIRKDETIETGEFLPPCVEAALNLGCVPVRSSRSQRNSNPRSYLGSRNQDPTFTPPKPMTTATNTRNLDSPNAERSNLANPTHIPPKPMPYPPSFEGFPRQSIAAETRGSSSVYPLYHGANFQPQALPMGFPNTRQNTNPVFIGTPVFQAAPEPPPCSQTGRSESMFSFDGSKKSSRDECDLSLRLGPVSSSDKGSTFADDSNPGPSKEFCFFPVNSEAENVVNVEANARKRGQCFAQLEPNDRMKRRGL